MSTLSPEGIYRAMVEENGLPKLGAASTSLGIRLGVDIEADPNGAVHRPAFLPGEKNGLSCSATIGALPRFALPLAWGGLNKRTVLWNIDKADVPMALVAGDDATPGYDRPISIGPGVTMDYNDFVCAIQAIQPLWKKVAKN